jgi:hypothetical protein
MSSFDRCRGCRKPFKRLSTHIAQNAVCAGHYGTTAHKSSLPIPNNIHANTYAQGARTRLDLDSYSCQFDSHPILRKSAANTGRDKLPPVADENEVEDDFMVDDDNDVVLPFDDYDPDAVDDSASGSKEEEDRPDRSVLDLYEKLFLLRSNPLGLERFSREEKVQIELLELLGELKAPLKAFSRILHWAAKSNASGHVFKVGCQPSREKVVRNLYTRYNMNGLIPKEKQLYLPYSKRTVSVVYFNASEVFASLLSCPTLNKDANFLFDDQKDPFAAPLSRASHVGDINTGRCYRKSHRALVKKKGVDIILPSILAMDKTHIDLGGRLQMEPITISHGLLKHSVRRLPIAMRILGYINHSTPAHLPSLADLDTDFNAPTGLPKGTVVLDAPLRRMNDLTWSTYLLNETHMQIQFILEESGFLQLQNKGFKWKLHYNKKIYPVVFQPYVPFIIGDTEGHDRLCGHYTARFSAVKQLCRVCECPTYFSGYSKSKFAHRLPKDINKLVERGHLDGLKSLSQNYLKNGFDSVRFGLHNKRGIFGACPGEMLHLISLGWFKYLLDAFASQAGSTSVALKHYDRLCATLGRRLSRQSDRDLPRTNFPKGFSSGSNLMGHEIAGCLLVKLFALHTTSFRVIFKVGKKRKGATPEEQRLSNELHIQDWILVVSSLLQWHQWMKQPTIAKEQVKNSHLATQWLIRQVAKVSPRTKGMGNNTIKTHLALHLCEDILDHGVPDNVNSAYAESAHIPLAKMTSRNTQKRAVSFTKQAAHRYVENLAVTLASADVANDVKLMGSRLDTPSPTAAPVDAQPSGVMAGRQFTISWTTGEDSATFSWNRKGPSDDPDKDRLPSPVTEYLSEHCLPHMPNGKLPCFTEFVSVRDDLYRAHPNIYDGGAWNDHAMVKWHKVKALLPAFIHTFVDLRGLPKGKSISVRSTGQTNIKAGLYALVHSFSPVNEEDLSFSNTLIGHYTVHRASQGERPILYLVDVEAIKSPTVGIPDVGWTPNGHPKMQSEQHHLFLVRRKADWPLAWDSMIDDLADDADDQSVENEYEKVVTLAHGAKIVSVKTDEEMAADAAKRKAAADETATNETAGETTSQSKPAARSKRPPLGRQPPSEEKEEVESSGSTKY